MGCYVMTMDSLPEGLTVLDLAGAAHPLGSLSGTRPAVVAFVRHFG